MKHVRDLLEHRLDPPVVKVDLQQVGGGRHGRSVQFGQQKITSSPSSRCS